jgi:hypothetical protein
MNAFQNHTTITAHTVPMPAHHVVASLASELQAAGEILATFHHFSSMAPILHAMADLKARGVIESDVLRKIERAAVLSMAKRYLAQHTVPIPNVPCSAASRNLVRRLRTVAGQSTIKPPALDLEAADHIEQLVSEIDSLRRREAGAKGAVE